MSLNVRSLRSKIGIVTQEPVLFSASVWENVAYGLIDTPFEHATKEEKMELVIKACKIAHAHTFIQSLPQKYSTEIGERAALLSGGQRQRISIARSIISNPPILLLDEATSALDTKNERLVQAALNDASQGRTTISIAHRLSTIKKAEQIVVMNGGRVIEVGDHDGLMAKEEGAYAALVATQTLKEQEVKVGESEGIRGDDDDDRHTVAEDAEKGEKTEKPEVMTRKPSFKRQKTSKSSNSETVRADSSSSDSDSEEDVETGIKTKKEKRSNLFKLVYRLVRMNDGSKLIYVIGAMGATILGLAMPVSISALLKFICCVECGLIIVRSIKLFSIIFGAYVGTYSNPNREEWTSRNNRLAGIMFAL